MDTVPGQSSKMKFLVVIALAVACAHADVSHVLKSADQTAETLVSNADVRPDGYNYNYETSNGIAANAEAVVQNANSEYPTQVVRGSYKYTGPDGVDYVVNYVADENGYKPEGVHLPVAPPVPEAIQRSLEFLRTHATPEVRSSVPVAAVPVVPVQVAIPGRTVAAPVRVAASASVGGFRGFGAQRNTKPFGQF